MVMEITLNFNLLNFVYFITILIGLSAKENFNYNNFKLLSKFFLGSKLLLAFSMFSGDLLKVQPSFLRGVGQIIF
jgi:hypothetical protein